MFVFTETDLKWIKTIIHHSMVDASVGDMILRNRFGWETAVVYAAVYQGWNEDVRRTDHYLSQAGYQQHDRLELALYVGLPDWQIADVILLHNPTGLKVPALRAYIGPILQQRTGWDEERIRRVLDQHEAMLKSRP